MADSYNSFFSLYPPPSQTSLHIKYCLLAPASQNWQLCKASTEKPDCIQYALGINSSWLKSFDVLNVISQVHFSDRFCDAQIANLLFLLAWVSEYQTWITALKYLHGSATVADGEV